MWFHEADGEKEGGGLVAEFPQCFNSQRCHLAVGVGVIRNVRRLKCRAAGIGSGPRNTLFPGAVAIRFPRKLPLVQNHVLPEGIGDGPRVLPGNRPGGRIVIATVINLAHPLHEVTVLLEVLAQGDDIRKCFPKVGHQIPDLGRIRSGPGHEAAACR